MIILYFIFIVKLEILRELKIFGIDKINIILYMFHNHGDNCSWNYRDSSKEL
jgi:hypothetical protein